jgi:hypothetical protein
MWYLLTIIIAIIGSFVAMIGEPMGAIGFTPMIIGQIWCDIKPSKKQ